MKKDIEPTLRYNNVLEKIKLNFLMKEMRQMNKVLDDVEIRSSNDQIKKNNSNN